MQMLNGRFVISSGTRRTLISASAWLGVVLIVILLGHTAINPRVDSYLENAAFFLSSKDTLYISIYEWPAYFWVAVGSVYFFGMSPIPLIVLNMSFLLLAISILSKFSRDLASYQRHLLAASIFLLPETLLYVVSPSKDSILSSALVAAIALWILIHSRQMESNQFGSIALLVFLVLVVLLLRPTAVIILGVALSAVSIFLWLRRKVKLFYVWAPALASLGLFWVGREISVLIGGVGKPGSFLLSALLEGHQATRSHGTQMAEDSPELASATTSQVETAQGSLTTLIMPDGAIEVVLMGILRAPLLLIAPFGSSSAFETMALTSPSIQSMYWAALASAIVILALSPFWIRTLKVSLKTNGSLADIQLLTVAALTMLILIATALPIIHERYRLPVTMLLAFAGIFTFFTWQISRRRRLLWLATPLIAGSIIWVVRVLFL